MLYILDALPYSEFMWEIKKYEENLDILAIYYKNDKVLFYCYKLFKVFIIK